MARKKKAKDAFPVKIIESKPNRYCAQGIVNEHGEDCCCHMTPLFNACDGCTALEGTKRQPTLIGLIHWRAKPDDRVRGTIKDFVGQCADFNANDGPVDE